MTGDIATVKEYLDRGMDVDAKKSDRYQTRLQIAAAAAQKPMVEYLLDGAIALRPGGLLALNVDSWEKLIGKALYFAAKNGHREIVALLLERSAEVNPSESAPLKNWQTTSAALGRI